MRIAFVEPHLEPFGGIRRIVSFANGFVARGDDVTVYHPEGTPCRWLECRARIRPWRDLRADRHDVVIFNNPPDYRRVRRCRAPLKVFYILALYDRDRLKRFDPKILWPKRGRMLSLKRALQLPFLRVSNATWMQRWLREELGIETHLQLGGVDRTLFHPVAVERRGGGFRILASGDPRRHKGTATVREAVERVRARRPDVVFETYHGRGIPQSEMARVYAGADLFVDGQWYAGWNNPVVEAMACGTPVVCTDIGGVADFAHHGRTALLVPPKDPEAMASAIERMIADAGLRARLAEAALREVERFDWDRAVDEFRALLARELRRARGEDP